MTPRTFAVPAGLALLVLLAGWGGRTIDTAVIDPAVVTIAARDFAYTVPATVPSGLVELRMVNTGSEMHHMQLVRLEQGRTAEELVRALQAGGPPPAWAEMVGGPNAVSPGDTANSVQDLSPGSYAILCFIPSGDKVPHFMKGMHRDLRVVGSTRRAAEPKADVTMKLVDYSFQLSRPLAPGRQTIRVENVGPQPHEVELVRFHPGKTFADFAKWEHDGMKGAPPLDLLGGVVGLAAGRHAYFSATLEPGTYGLICFLPDAKDGKPHLEHGMVQEFEVGME